MSRFLSCQGRCRKIYSNNGAKLEMNYIESASFLGKINNRFMTLRLWKVLNDNLYYHTFHILMTCRKAPLNRLSDILRTTREMRLTFEELYAVLTRIEACMNSQPRILYIPSHPIPRILIH